MSSESIANTMNQDVTAALVPKLRFPEFRGTGEWEVTSIGDLKPFVTSGSRGWAPFYAEKGELFVRITNLRRSSIYLDLTDSKFVQLPSGASEGVRTQLKEHDVLISITADIGIIGYVDEGVPSPAYINQHIALVRFNKEQLCGKYVAYFLATEKSQRLFRASTDTGTKAGMSLTGIHKIKLTLPGLPEQHHIADCLSSLDELIAAQAQKVGALKTHKKGLMQQLFPREGETQPRLRFPEFQDAGAWEVKRLDDLAKRGSGHTPSKRNHDYYNGGIKWVSLADSKRLDSGLISQTESEISIEGIKNSSAVLHPTGSVLLSRDAGVGKSAIMDSPMDVSQHFIVWTCDPSRLSNWFLYYMLQGMKSIFERIATGSTIKTIGLPFFKELTLIVPAPEEQQRIASCLGSLDALITAETQKLEALKTHKTGLMQQLFPSLEGETP